MSLAVESEVRQRTVIGTEKTHLRNQGLLKSSFELNFYASWNNKNVKLLVKSFQIDCGIFFLE